MNVHGYVYLAVATFGLRKQSLVSLFFRPDLGRSVGICHSHSSPRMTLRSLSFNRLGISDYAISWQLVNSDCHSGEACGGASQLSACLLFGAPVTRSIL